MARGQTNRTPNPTTVKQSKGQEKQQIQAQQQPSLASAGNQSSFQGASTSADRLKNTFNKADALKKKTRMHAIKQFLTLKRKILQLINLKRAQEAKTAYDALYRQYQELARLLSETEILRFRSDLSTIYTQLTTEMQKRVKKGHFTNVEVKKPSSKIKQKKIVTTDLDVILHLVEEKGKINLAEIQTRFSISKALAEEWIQILADYGLVEIRYLPIGGVEITKID